MRSASPSIPDALASVGRIDFRLTPEWRVPEIEERLNATVLAGGKRLRPLLLVLFGQLHGVPESRLAPYARAAELVHAASLAHDDVVDEAELRRDRPTLNAVTSNARAVLAGDLLLSRVVDEVAALGEIGIIRDLAAVIRSLSEAEWLQLEARGLLDPGEAHLVRVARGKTGALMGWCGAVPARLAGASPEGIEAAREFGERLGLAFQRMDDAIDFRATGGKPFAQDLREGLVNFVVQALLEREPGRRPHVAALLGRDFSPEEWSRSPGIDVSLAAAVAAVEADARRDLELGLLRLQEAGTPGEPLAELRRLITSLWIERSR